MKKRSFLTKVIAALGVIVIICMILLIPPVGDKVGAMVNIAGSTIRSWAQMIAGIAIGAIMVLTAIVFAGSMPIVAGIVALAGLGMLIWNLIPIFRAASEPPAGKL